MPKPTISAGRRKRLLRARRQSGFTLLEMGIAITLMAMIFVGTWTMYVSMAQTAVRSQSEVFASQSAANALQYMIMQSRESWDFVLPGESHTYSAWQPGTYLSTSSGGTYTFQTLPNYTNIDNYQATNNSTGQTINTAVEILEPTANQASTTFQGSNGTSSPFTFTPSGGTDASLYSIGTNTPGLPVLFYRSDANGVPDPSAGMYLWMYSLDSGNPGATYNKKLVELFDTQSAAAAVWNAIQFDRPDLAGSNVTLPFELEIKIICGNYSPINGIQTNEATNGADSTSLTGKCVLMRDHLLDGYSISGGNSTTPIDNIYRATGT